MGVAIKIRDLHKSYGSIAALKGVNFDIDNGAVFGLLGTNGAGKTTLIKILVNLIRANQGEAVLHGIPCNDERPL